MIHTERRLISEIEKYIAETELTPHEKWEIDLTKQQLERKLADKILKDQHGRTHK